MTESIKLMKLDFMMIKHYWKEMLCAGIILMVSILPTLPLAFNVILFIAGNTLLAYPYMIEEKDKMDKFYSIIAISKLDIIRGKYLSAIVYMLGISIFLVPLNLIFHYVMKVDSSPSMILLLGSIGVLLYSIIASIQFPSYMKWGYTKSKIITMVLPMAIGIGIPIIVLGATKLIGKEQTKKIMIDMIQFFNNHNSVLILGALIIGSICLGISYKISSKICLNKK